MAEPVPSWAVESVKDRLDVISANISTEIMSKDKELCTILQHTYEALRSRLEELEADKTKIDVYEEFEFLCMRVGEEMRSSWDAILQRETKLTTVAASIGLSAMILQAMVAGMVISVLGSTVIRTRRYLLPSEAVLNARDEHKRRLALLSRALKGSSDIRYPAFAITELGFECYQKLLNAA